MNKKSIPSNDGKKRYGMSIKALSAFMFVTAVLTIAMSIFGFHRTVTYAHMLYELEQERITYDKTIQQLMDGSDYMTTQVQQFVIQRNRKYMDNYWSEVYVEKSRDTALDVIRNANLTQNEKEIAETAKKESDLLMQREIWAMRLVSEGLGIKEEDMPKDVAEYKLSNEETSMDDELKLKMAVSYIFGPVYSISKNIIRSNVNSFRYEISSRYANETMSALKRTERTTYALAIGLIVFFLLLSGSIYCFITQVASPLVAFSGKLSKDDDGFIKLDENGALEIRQFAASFNELSEQVRQNTERLARLGYIDYLTDVPNRVSITEYVSNMIQGKMYPLGLLIIDIDNFKCFNDTYGHMVGDCVLKCVAHSICSVHPENGGISGRLCGEEFVVAVMNTDREGLESIAEQILQNVRNISAEDINSDGINELHITVSAGGMIWNGEHQTDFTSLLTKADKALYASKEGGKDRYTFGGNFAE